MAYRLRALLLMLAALLLLGGCDDAARMAPLPDGARVLAFGDSLTFGTGASAEQSYPAQLAALTGLEVIRSGLPGELSSQGLQRLPALLDQHRPALLLLCHGGNDLLRKQPREQLTANLRAMIDAAQSRGIAVLLIGVPRPGLLLSSEPLYAQLAEAQAIPYEGEALATILADARLKSDAVHPNAAGYRLLAERIAALLSEQGAR